MHVSSKLTSISSRRNPTTKRNIPLPIIFFIFHPFSRYVLDFTLTLSHGTSRVVVSFRRKGSEIAKRFDSWRLGPLGGQNVLMARTGEHNSHNSERRVRRFIQSSSPLMVSVFVSGIVETCQRRIVSCVFFLTESVVTSCLLRY